jgi:hypothetical protein
MPLDSERCKGCGHEYRWHHYVGKDAPVPCFENNLCSCRAFVASGVFNCEGVIKGDLRSPRGTNQRAACYHVAKFSVEVPGHGPFLLCGVHVRAFTPPWNTVTEVPRDPS